VIEMDQANASKSTVERTPKYRMEVGNIEVQMARTVWELFTAVKMKQWRQKARDKRMVAICCKRYCIWQL